MTHENHFGSPSYSRGIKEVADEFDLDLSNLKVEFFNPGHQGIFVESVGDYQFRIHVSMEEDRIIAVKKIKGPESSSQITDPFKKYKAYMK